MAKLTLNLVSHSYLLVLTSNWYVGQAFLLLDLKADTAESYRATYAELAKTYQPKGIKFLIADSNENDNAVKVSNINSKVGWTVGNFVVRLSGTSIPARLWREGWALQGCNSLISVFCVWIRYVSLLMMFWLRKIWFLDQNVVMMYLLCAFCSFLVSKIVDYQHWWFKTKMTMQSMWQITSRLQICLHGCKISRWIPVSRILVLTIIVLWFIHWPCQQFYLCEVFPSKLKPCYCGVHFTLVLVGRS